MKPILKSLYQYSRNEEIKGLIFNAFNESYHVRAAVAKYENVRASVLEYLSNDKNYYVRKAVAGNPRTPAHILDKLSKDEEYYVCYCVAGNPSTPAYILERFINNKDRSDVHISIARNPNVPIHFLKRLRKDENDYVRYLAIKNLRQIKWRKIKSYFNHLKNLFLNLFKKKNKSTL